ncbi:MAG: RNA polymerase sigma factor RpoH [Alphaproteobacteria bacterium]|nr:RNA polymerase sigma factor RpoH [Alphaproteobacteria bacterium]MBQ8346109.1 RNA polymerase sigma factor RpoH [Alphaproteobacteria bacterium]
MTTTLLPVVQNGIQSYLASIRRIPVLSAEEEYMLANRFRDHGDLTAAKKLISAHLRLAAKIAFSYRFYGLPLEDLISEANIGLMQAVKRFEPDKGNRLSTYAVWWIKAAVNEFILKSWSLVRIGTIAAQKRLFYNLRKIKARLGLYGDSSLDADSIKEISQDLNVSEEDVTAMDMRLNGDVSLNTPVFDDGYAERQDFLTDETNIEDDLADRQESNIRLQLLAQAMNKLNEREKIIVQARRLSENPDTLDALGERLGISRERVRQIENRAIEKMTQYIQNRC